MKETFDFKDDNKNTINAIKINFNYVAAILIVIFILYVVIKNPILNPRFSSAQIIYLITITLITLRFVKNKKVSGIIFSVGIVIIIGLEILSSPLFHSKAYYNLLGDVKTVDYYDNVPDIDNTKLPVVDSTLAEKLGDKVLGQDVGLGSQFKVGEYYLISENDNLAWVAPLEPRGFFKWLQNIQGSPGYVYVSATDPNDVRLVQDINGSPIHIKYSNNSYFLNNIYRHAYLSGNMFRGMTDFSFEIDDQGNPYWVITSYAPSILVSGYDTTGVIIIDAQSGKSDFYSNIEDAPAWVERVQPSWLVSEQINDWGSYKNGWLNTILGQKDMITQTEGFSYVYIGGKPYYYSGLTSITNDQSTVGFMLVDLRNKVSTFYQLTGATETAGQSSAQGQVQQYGYQASFPILVNEYGTATYFMTLKDADGLLKQYAFVSVENYNIVGVGNSIEEAKLNYYDALKNNNKIDNTKVDVKTVTGELERINYVDGKYYLKLKNNNVLFSVESDISLKLPLTITGDTVEITYIPSDDLYNYVTVFDDKSIGAN